MQAVWERQQRQLAELWTRGREPEHPQHCSVPSCGNFQTSTSWGWEERHPAFASLSVTAFHMGPWKEQEGCVPKQSPSYKGIIRGITCICIVPVGCLVLCLEQVSFKKKKKKKIERKWPGGYLSCGFSQLSGSYQLVEHVALYPVI